MRTTLTAVLLCGALSLTTAVRAAERPAGDKAGGERAEKARERMQEVTEKLGLTEAQKEKLKPIFQAQGEKMKELMGNSDLSREQKFEKMKAMREEMAPKFKEIFTPEQFEKWQKMREEMRGKVGERGKQRRGGEKK